MYGTIFRLRPQAGREADVAALTEEWAEARGPQVQGARAVYLLQSERRSGDLLGVAVFESEEAYRANADTPEQENGTDGYAISWRVIWSGKMAPISLPFHSRMVEPSVI